MGEFGIGQPVRRFEDKRLLSGNGRFQSDNNLHGQAYAYLLRSPHAHARIRKLDLASAQAVPGIALIMTGDDLVEAKLGVMGVPFQRKRPDGSPMFARAFLGLAQGTVRYAGEPVAFVVAETLAQAKDAAELIDIDYEALPSVTDTAEAAEGKIQSRSRSSRRSRKHSGAARWSMPTVSRSRHMAARSFSKALCDPGRNAKRPNALPGWHQGSPGWTTELR
jgi:carbon-monoxide dehydrogenase large subunit